MASLESRHREASGIQREPRERPGRRPALKSSKRVEGGRERPSTQQVLAEESIILRKRRPELAIRDDSAVLEFADPKDTSLWKTTSRRRQGTR